MTGSRSVGVAAAAAMIALLHAVSASASDWYAGIGVGASRLSPGGGDREGDSSGVFGGFAGRRLSERIAIEAGASSLGGARTEYGRRVEYSTASIGVLGYLIESREGTGGPGVFLRAGANRMFHSSLAPIEGGDAVGLQIALGVDAALRSGWGARLEVASHDGDAISSGAYLVWRPGERRDASGPEGLVREAPVPRAGAGAMIVAANAVRSPRNDEAAAEGRRLHDSRDDVHCPTIQETRDAGGVRSCALFDGTLRGVTFVAGTARLTDRARARLAALASELESFPEIRIEIGAHVFSRADREASRELARARARASAFELVAHGIPVTRLLARGFVTGGTLQSVSSGGGERDRISIRSLAPAH